MQTSLIKEIISKLDDSLKFTIVDEGVLITGIEHSSTKNRSNESLVYVNQLHIPTKILEWLGNTTTVLAHCKTYITLARNCKLPNATIEMIRIWCNKQKESTLNVLLCKRCHFEGQPLLFVDELERQLIKHNI